MTTLNSHQSPPSRLAARAPEVPARGLASSPGSCRPRRSSPQRGSCRVRDVNNFSGALAGDRGYRRPQRAAAADRRRAPPAVHARPRLAARPRPRRPDAAAADRVTGGDLTIDSFWSALGVALVAAAVGVVLDVLFGTNDDDTYTLRVIQRIARRSGERTSTDAPGHRLPRDRRARAAGAAAGDARRQRAARWRAGSRTARHQLAEWETDLSSQTGATQAGILLGSNENIPAFRWVEKESAKLVACSGPADCAEIERAPFDRTRAPRQRRREPRQPALRRSRPRDPDRQPHGRREEGQPRLPRVLRERLQRRPRRSSSSAGR